MAPDDIPSPVFERASSIDDQATQVEERERAAAIAAQRDRAALEPKLADGVCANCDEVLSGTQHFCDDSCRNDYQRRESARRRNGK